MLILLMIEKRFNSPVWRSERATTLSRGTSGGWWKWRKPGEKDRKLNILIRVLEIHIELSNHLPFVTELFNYKSESHLVVPLSAYLANARATAI